MPRMPRKHISKCQSILTSLPAGGPPWPSTAKPFPSPHARTISTGKASWQSFVGKELRDVTPEAAQAGFFGYACFNDLTARKFQMASDRWTLGKNTDSSGPLGPWIVTAEENPEPDQPRIQTHVNGNAVQDGNTSNLISSGAKIAAYASGAMTLKPGDLIATGTPEGVGASRKPPMFLHPGDTVEVEIERIGRITNRIVER